MTAERKAISASITLIMALVFLIPGLCWPSRAAARTYEPDVTTNSATGISSDHATLKATLDSDGNEDINEYGFYWGTSSGSLTHHKIVGYDDISEDDDFDYRLTGLIEGTTYYYKAYAENDEDTSYGSVKHFTTTRVDGGGNAPEVTTNSASSIGSTQATLNGYIDWEGSSGITEYGFYWGTSSNPTTKHSLSGSVSEGDDFYYDLSGLDEGTKYYFKAYAENSEDTSYGDVLSFTAGWDNSGDAEVETDSASSIDDDRATLNANLVSDGGSDITEYGFYWGTSSGSLSHHKIAGYNDISEGDDFDCRLTDLDEDETYYYKAYVISDGDYSYGSVRHFTTDSDYYDNNDDDYYGSRPSVTTKTPDSESGYARLYGVVRSRGDSRVRSYGFYWGTDSSPDTKVEVNDNNISPGSTFSYHLDDLTDGSTYYVKAYATNSHGTSYGNVLRFRATGGGGELADLTTNVTDIGSSSAILIGAIGGEPVREYGFLWGKSGGVQTKVKLGTTIAENTIFTYALSGLQSGSSYFAKSYAITASGTAYGSEVGFTPGAGGNLTPFAAGGGEAPVVTISSPSANSSVAPGAAVNICASASDDTGVQAMGLYINGLQKLRCNGNAFSYYLDSSALTSGQYTIRITAWDGTLTGENQVTLNV
ncbi:MAG TPA: Ig-like domain-containing protein [Syntrophomonadaceae bacterium]|nr:Ig-like domain-containing protein [Syntrophomonadaceae bacterium]